MNARSLRFRLAAWHAGLLTAVFILLGALLYIQLRTYLENTLLDTQVRRAQQIADTLLGNTARVDEPRVAAEIEALYAPEHSDRFIRLTRGDGRVAYVSGSPIDQSFDARAVAPVQPFGLRASVRKQVLPDGHTLLIAAVPAASRGGGFLVEVGTAAAPVETMLGRLLLLLSLGLPVVLLVAATGGYLLVRRALQPVDEIARKAEVITQQNLSERLPVPRTGDELERLSVSLNHMIQRLDDDFEKSQRFVADASHELRTPLTVVRGELESLAQDPALDRDSRERLGSLLEEAERLSKIVERLLTISRLDAGEAQPAWVRFDLAGLAAATAEQLVLVAEDRGITITCEAGGPVPVRGDQSRLKQVIVNLLDNAIKYTPIGGRVRIRVALQASQAVLEVADNGVGIPLQALPHVFDRFYRVDPSRSREPDGTGLGLAIVKAIVQAHGGKVEAESTPGQGSLFRVLLPLAVG
jgi:heavy metal sensor kinase